MQTLSGPPAVIPDQLALLGQSPGMDRLRAQLRRIAPHFRTALVTGGPGSGVAAVARTLHTMSPEAGKPLISINSVLESHPSHGATLLLPELSDLTPSAQSLVLLALHRGMRVIAATEHSPKTLTAANRLRADLYTALAAAEITLPALNTRLEDLPELVQSIAGNRTMTPEFLAALNAHPWSGNLAELTEVLRQAMQCNRGSVLENLPDALRTAVYQPAKLASLQDVIDQHVFMVLNACAGNKLRAAEVLGISRSTLYRMLASSPFAHLG